MTDCPNCGDTMWDAVWKCVFCRAPFPDPPYDKKTDDKKEPLK